MALFAAPRDTRPTGSDITSPMSEPIGRGSGGTATPTTVRRVRHEVADAAKLAMVSLAASAGVGSLLLLGAHLVGSA